MIDFTAENGKEYWKHESDIVSYLTDCVSWYKTSLCFKSLKKRFDKLKESADMAYNRGNSSYNYNVFASKVSMPLVREQMIARRAALKANFRADPLITVNPCGSTPYENAINSQQVLDSNLKITRFRETVLNRFVFDSLSKYGSAVTFAMLDNGMKKTQKTVYDGSRYAQQQIVKHSKTIKNIPVHILNYGQNPDVADSELSNFKFIYRRLFLSDMIALVKNSDGRYIHSRLAEVVKEAIQGMQSNKNFYAKEQVSSKMIGMDVLCFWGTITIKGNEEDETPYYCEMVGDKIIRFQTHDLDNDIIPITCYSLDMRADWWFGNADAENVIPYENFINVMMQTTADQAMKAMERFIFYKGGTINPALLNDAKRNGGFVNLDWKDDDRPLNAAFWEYEGRTGDISAVQYVTQEAKEAAQRVTSKVDLARKANQGGIQNKTLGAAQMIEQQGDVKESDYLESVSEGIKHLGLVNLTMLQQFLSDKFKIRPKIQDAQRVLEKKEILGDFYFDVESSWSTNKQMESIRLQNIITGIYNFKGTKDPSWNNVNLVPIIRKWIQQIDPKVDIDEVMPEESAFQMQGYQPSAQTPGIGQGGAAQPVEQVMAA